MARYSDIKVPVSDVASGAITVKVRLSGLRRWKVRIALCSWLLRLAAWIAPSGVDVSID